MISRLGESNSITRLRVRAHEKTFKDKRTGSHDNMEQDMEHKWHMELPLVAARQELWLVLKI